MRRWLELFSCIPNVQLVNLNLKGSSLRYSTVYGVIDIENIYENIDLLRSELRARSPRLPRSATCKSRSSKRSRLRWSCEAWSPFKMFAFFTFTFLRWKNIVSERRDCWPTIPSWRRRMWRFKSRFSQLICFNLDETETSFSRPGVEPAKHHGWVWGSEARDPPLARGSWSPQLAGWWCLSQSMKRLASECFVR